MSGGAEQLTLDGRSVPHDDVVRGASTSRMVRRPELPEAARGKLYTPELIAFVDAVAKALDNAGVRPGEAFYVSRVPPVDRPREGGARRSDPSTSKRAAKMSAPRRGSHRWLLLSEFLGDENRGGDGLTAEQACMNTCIDGGWRRVSELLAGGFIEPTGAVRSTLSKADAEVYRITDKGRDTLAAGRTT